MNDDRSVPWDYNQPDEPEYWEDADPQGFDRCYTLWADMPRAERDRQAWYCPYCGQAARFFGASESYFTHVPTCRGNLRERRG